MRTPSVTRSIQTRNRSIIGRRRATRRVRTRYQPSANAVSLRFENDSLTGVVLEARQTIPVNALAVGVPARSNTDVLQGLGITAEADPAGFGTIVPNDPATGATSVPGVWVAGNVGDFKSRSSPPPPRESGQERWSTWTSSPTKPQPLSPTTLTRSVPDPKQPTQ
jgi:thioredoxin reductase